MDSTNQNSDMWIEKNLTIYSYWKFIVILVIGILVYFLVYYLFSFMKKQKNRTMLPPNSHTASVTFPIFPSQDMVHSIPHDEFLPGRLYNTNYDGYSQAVQSGKPFIVMFHANWCGPCKATFPKFEEAAKKHHSLPFVAVESNFLSASQKQQLGIESFPTIRIVKGNSHKEHTGGRSVEDFVKLAFY